MASLARWWGPVVLFMGLIFWSSSSPRPPSLDETPDFWLHGGAYFVLALLSVRALSKGLAEPGTSLALVLGVALAVAYGVTDEWHQSFVPGRDASLTDVVFDSLGALAAGAAVGWFWKTQRARGAQSVQ